MIAINMNYRGAHIHVEGNSPEEVERQLSPAINRVDEALRGQLHEDRPMENQHRKISGYRDLTQGEIDLMNELKELEAQCLAAQKRVMQHLSHQEEHGTMEDKARLREAYGHRWAQIGKTDIETGFMALIRAVAQPQPRGE